MKKAKALVIDDEQIVLDSVKKILLEGDYDVEVTPSGRQGLEWGVQKEYDVVLTDIRMPDIGGMVVLRDLKRARPVLPVVINEILWSMGITAYSVVYARISTDSIAAMNIVASIDQMALVLFNGIGHACAVLVGNRIGAGDRDQEGLDAHGPGEGHEHHGEGHAVSPALGESVGRGQGQRNRSSDRLRGDRHLHA